MKPVSIFNDVIGPVMRGPSSSHTAASFHIGRLARDLLGDQPTSVTVVFAENGSYAEVYRQQGSDLALTAGLLGWSITDERFFKALEEAKAVGLRVNFTVEHLQADDHPNAVEIRMISEEGRRTFDDYHLKAVAKSIGGGAVVFTRLNGWQVQLTGDAHEVLVVLDKRAEQAVSKIITRYGSRLEPPRRQTRGDEVLLHVRRANPLDNDTLELLKSMPGVIHLWTASPIFFRLMGKPLFSSGSEMVSSAEDRGCSLGRMALAYEAALLGVSEEEALQEMLLRFDVMRAAVDQGLGEDLAPMQLLRPSAHKVFQAEGKNLVAIGGIHARAAARAMAVMHVNSSMGVVCAAPTGGAAGTIPGVMVTLAEEKKLNDEQIALALFAASAVGLVVATRASFAAEVAGCQVEIGAAGAMASAAVVEVAGGAASQATDAAAIFLQNTMGSVCDLVQGIVEIPCHTRNAVAASAAFVCADLVIGGYENRIPLDETVDAVYAVGKMLPRELRCTALGGLAATPSALTMPRLER
jgi:L-serine dehydratase